MIKNIVSGMQKVQVVVGTLFLAIFLVAVLIQIFARYVGVAVTWTEDVSLYAFIWAVFMGASAMVFEGKHFAFTSLSDKLKSPALKRGLSILISGLILLFAVLILFYGARITKQFWNYRWVTIPSFKRGPVWLCLPIAGGMMTIYALYHIVSDVLNFKKGA
ncbi:MAG: TRAP transporter small permease subunit [Spirochaetaceae bacterium]|jgi:TRAP-type C4-dicarboxylate transport system permease small subunit|nr:TRAP transporter small permease subunit [Spirochaetaceae bacterium]